MRFWEFSRGIDEREVENSHTAKSISKEITFEIDTNDLSLIENVILDLSDNVAHQLRQSNIYCSTIEADPDNPNLAEHIAHYQTHPRYPEIK